MIIGAILPFFFTSFLMNAVGVAAQAIVFEVRRQFKEIPGIMDGTAKPEYGKCVDLVTVTALRQLAVPAIIAVVTPLAVGFVLGPVALAGLLLGVILSGFPLAIMMTTGGGAWDNGKKYIESGHFGGKHSDAHKAAIVGRHGRGRDQGHGRPRDQPAHQGREHDLDPVHRADRGALGDRDLKTPYRQRPHAAASNRSEPRSPERGLIMPNRIAHRSEPKLVTRSTARSVSHAPRTGRLRRGSGRRTPIPRFSLGHMDPDADPAQDFYRYATGGWTDSNPVPPDKTRWSGFDELRERNFALLHGILEAASRSTPDRASPVRRQVGTFYAAAMDAPIRAKLRLTPIAEELRKIEAIDSSGSLMERLADLHKSGFHGLFSAYVIPDLKKSTVYALYLHQGGLSLPDRDYYLQARFGPLRKAYRRHIVRMLVLAGDPVPRARKAAHAVLAIETALARASRSRVDLRDPDRNYNRRPVTRLDRRHPRLTWSKDLRRRGSAGCARWSWVNPSSWTRSTGCSDVVR